MPDNVNRVYLCGIFGVAISGTTWLAYSTASEVSSTDQGTD